MKKQLLAAALALAASATAMAGSFYGGVGGQYQELDVGATTIAVDGTSPGLRLVAGYNLSGTWAVEGVFSHARDMAVAQDRLKSDEASLSLLGAYPLSHNVKVLGKLGLSHGRLSSGGVETSGESVLVGAGLSYALNKDWSLRAEVEHTRDFAGVGKALNKASVLAIKTF